MLDIIYDVIIIGAGPIGLILAKELSINSSVLLIDKNKIPTFQKSWCVPRKWISNTYLENYVSHELTRFGMYTHTNQQHSIRRLSPSQHVVTLDEKKMYEDILTDLQKSNCAIKESLEIKSFCIANDLAVVHGENNEFKGKLVIDCTGINSPFIEKDKNLKHKFYWNVYGIKYSGTNTEPNLSYLAAHVGSHKNEKIFINDIPEGNGEYTPWMYITSPKRYTIDEMRKIYQEIILHPFIKEKIANHKPLDEKFGWIPAFDYKNRASCRMLHLGDAGGLAPWTNAMSYSFALKKLDDVVHNINQCLSKNTLDEQNLKTVFHFSKTEELNFDLGKIVFFLLMSSTPHEFEKFLDLFEKVDFQPFVNFIIFLESDLSEIKGLLQTLLKYFSPQELLQILGRDGYKDESVIIPEIFMDLLRELT